jgi:hypothetical protein
VDPRGILHALLVKANAIAALKQASVECEARGAR